MTRIKSDDEKAYAEYKKVRDAAFAECNKIRQAAWAEYEKVRERHGKTA